MKKKMIMSSGNDAVARIAYALTEAAPVYPITPSSCMGEAYDAWSTKGLTNLMGVVPRAIQMHSEAGAAGTLHGLLSAGALATTFTASQGLLLMIPNMYKIVGELLPTVIHVSARTIAMHALSIFGDHSDISAVRSTGFAMLCSSSVQEAQDMALVAHLSALEASYPFLHFFDGFRTSHEINKIVPIENAEIKRLIPEKAIAAFRARALNPEKPHQQGTAQNPDIFFQNREAANKIIDAVPGIVENNLKKVGALTGKTYKPFEYVGSPTAKQVVVAMGSSCETIEETIEKLNTNGEDYGLIKVRLLRPFIAKNFIKVLPRSVEVLTVLDRTKENGSNGPLFLDIVSALYQTDLAVRAVSGRYGLASKEFTPDMVAAVYDNMKSNNVKHNFTVGITDDVTNSSLTIVPKPELAEDGGYVFYGLGSDGTVSANKNSVAIVGDNSNLYAQAYFVFDSKKSGSVTVSHLRFSEKSIGSTYLVTSPCFVACHNQTFLKKFDVLSGIKEGGTFLLNTNYSVEELENILPANVKKTLAEKDIKFYIINAYKIASDVGLGKRINTIMQAAFFQLANILPFEKARAFMKDAIERTYSKKGEAVLGMNIAAIDGATKLLKQVTVPESWKSIKITKSARPSPDIYYNNVAHPINIMRGSELPVSAFSPDGRVPTGTTKFEKRNIATELPHWIPENCIQCNQCAFVCPHATIRPHLVEEADLTDAPKTFTTVKAMGFPNKQYRLQVSPKDCTGCASCANVCPAAKKALVMKDYSEVREDKNYEHSLTVPCVKVPPTNVKNSQFAKPLFEFSGACAGCGQTPYIKLTTQLFGSRMIIANATGCTSIYGGSSPTCPYTKNSKGQGPAWANSLFEDNAEFGFGIKHAYDIRRGEVVALAENLAGSANDKETKQAVEYFLETLDNPEENEDAVTEMIAALKSVEKTHVNRVTIREILKRADVLVEKSVWMIGGDGWAYDIGFGGLDHVISQNLDVNILVLDTEVYSNTGGQASKATSAGAIAKFASAGKEANRKDLGLMAMHYDNVYVAQVAIGANYNQTLTALKEAAEHKGPSLVIAYATCIAHGIDMANGMKEMKNAVDCGYWALYRRNPDTGLVIDSKPPSDDIEKFSSFLRNETRFNNLVRQDQDRASMLFEKAHMAAKKSYAALVAFSELPKQS